MMISLPPVATPVLVAAVEGLPARLRKKLDDAVAKFGDRVVTESQGQYTVAVDDATTVTLVTDGGVVRTPEAASCTCLLAPNCLHRAVVLALAPVGADEAPAESTSSPDLDRDRGADLVTPDVPVPLPVTTPAPAPVPIAMKAPVPVAIPVVDGQPEASLTDQPITLTTQQSEAVEQLWRAAVAVLGGGVSGSGTVARTALLRAAHEAQACKVYRPAAAARAVATLLQAARTNQAHYRLADLVQALRDLLGVTHQLRLVPAGPAQVGLLGSARQGYQLQGSLRLHGLFSTAVIADTGHAGVVTYVLDRTGKLWTIADLAPGDARRAASAGNATVALGETALSHRMLTRAGLVVSGATASASRRLGAGKSVRAVTAAGLGWHQEPLAALWATPAAEQIQRAFEALSQPIADRVSGSDLLFLALRVVDTDGDAVVASTADGSTLRLRVTSDHPALAYRENLQLLGRTPGLEMLVIGRPDPGRQATVYPLAVAPPSGTSWLLPAPYDGHVDLAYDRLHRSHLPVIGNPSVGSTSPGGPELTEAEHPDRRPGMAGPSAGDGQWQVEAGDPALQLLRAQLERSVAGGRAVMMIPPGRGRSEAHRLRLARLDGGAALLDLLAVAASTSHRDAFGRLTEDDGTAFAQAWLAAAVYTDAATRAYTQSTWLPA